MMAGVDVGRWLLVNRGDPKGAEGERVGRRTIRMRPCSLCPGHASQVNVSLIHSSRSRGMNP